MRKKMYKAGKSWMVAAIAVSMIAEPITADIVGISSIQEGMTVHAQPTTTEPDTTYSAPPLLSSSVKASGTFGTSAWTISMDGVLHIGAGEFAVTTNYSSPWNRYADKIKKIVFDGDVVANADSSSLFGGLKQVTSIEGLNKLDTHQVKYMNSMFREMSSLTSLDLSGFDTSQVTSMNSMFYGMSSLSSLDLSNFDTSQVTEMVWMFYGMSSLTSLDLSGFDTSQVKYMQYMFYGMSSLTSLDLSGFDTSQVAYMQYMFGGMSSLTSLDVSNFDTRQVNKMGYMFGGMSSLTSLDVSNFDTSRVTDMSDMFGGMSSLASLDLSNFDTRQVTDMGYMFSGMSSLTSLDVSNFNTSRVTEMIYMFKGMSSLTSLDLSNFDTSQVIDMLWMFRDMSKLNQITFGANFDTSAVTSDSADLPNAAGGKQWRQVGSGTVDKPAGAVRSSAAINKTNPVVADTYVLGTYIVADFWKPNAANTYGVAGLENYISSTDPFGNGNVKYVNDLTSADQTEVLAKGVFGTAKWYIGMDGTLHIGAGEFAAVATGGSTSDDSPWYGYKDKIKKIVFDGDVVANADSHSLFENLNQVTSIESLNKLDTHQVTNMSHMFDNMSSLTSLDLSNFDTSQVTNMEFMFSGLRKLTSLDVSSFDTSQVINMFAMFHGMFSLTSLDLSNFDTSQVTNMSSMFGSMSSLTSLDLSNFDTSQVTDMSAMFDGMYRLTSLDVSNFNTGQVTDMSFMFRDMSSLTSLDLSNFNTSQVTSMDSMFNGMSSLTSLDLSSFDTSQVTNMYSMFATMSSLTSLDLSNFNTSQVSRMDSMFYGMSSLTSLDLSSFDTSQVTNMNYMFRDMSKLTSLDLSNFDTSQVTDMFGMFRDMSSLNQIKFGANFDTSAAGSAVLPNVSDSNQWRQVGSGTVDKPAGEFRNSATINTAEPVVADTYVLTPTAKTEIVTTDTLSGSAKVGDAQTGAISQTGKLSFTVAGSDKGTITMALAKESSNVISGLHLASVKDDTEGTAKDYDITAGASTQIGIYSTSGTHNYSIDPSKSNIKLNSKSADPGSYTAATTYTMNNTPNA